MNNTDIQKALVSIGLGVGADARMMAIDGDVGPRTRDAVRRFQQGYAGSLVADGIPGPQTQNALAFCRYVGGLASRHFRFREFACSHCGYVNCRRGMIAGIEFYRNLRQFSGIEISSVHLVCHVDTRHLYGGGYSVDNPSVFTWPTTLMDSGLSQVMCHS
jgi:hypothetical protein